MRNVSVFRVIAAHLLALFVFLPCILLAGKALAGPQAGVLAQVPGYYRMTLGDFEITALFDGMVDIDSKLFTGVKPDELSTLLNSRFVDDANGVRTAVNAYLVNTGESLILVDAGSGKNLGPAMGALAGNLRAAGYDPAQVNTVLLTHLHPDHVLGLLTPEGAMAFPNAQVRASAPEAAFWLNGQEEAKAPEAMKRVFGAARSGLAPYIAQGRFKTFEKADAISPGVEAVFTPGHTLGHCCYMFTSKDAKFLVLGDIIHNHAAQFERPEICIEYDMDQMKALASRSKIFGDAAREKFWIAGEHIPFPGIGRLRMLDHGYAFVPVEFGPVASAHPESGI